MRLKSIEVVEDRTEQSTCSEGFLSLARLILRNRYEDGSAWADYACDVVIQSSQIDYERPMSARFTASSSLADTSAWPAFLKTLTRRKRALGHQRARAFREWSVVGPLMHVLGSQGRPTPKGAPIEAVT